LVGRLARLPGIARGLGGGVAGDGRDPLRLRRVLARGRGEPQGVGDMAAHRGDMDCGLVVTPLGLRVTYLEKVVR
jgi:hypothetical protein